MISHSFIFILALASILPAEFALGARSTAPVRILSGGHNSYDYLQEKKAELEKVAGVPVELIVRTTDIAMLLVSQGLGDAYIGSSIEDSLQLAEKLGGLPRQNRNDYKAFDFAENTIFVGVHPSNPVKSLSKREITDIANGKITNWEKLSGKNLPITVFLAKSYLTTTNLILNEYSIKNKPDAYQFVDDRTALLKALEKDPGALCFFTSRDHTSTFSPKFFATDIRHHTQFVIKKNARPSVQKVFNYLKDQPKYVQD